MDTLQKIIELMKIHKSDNLKLAAFLGLNRQAVTDWKAGRSKSYTKYLPQIAEFFGVSVDYLLGNDTNQNRENDSSIYLTEQEKTLIRMFRETTEEGRFEMITAIMNIQKRITGGGSTGKDSQSAV
ncbi:MAG: hypothetical protein IJ303_02870 [Clostridia bacterium]|nr:hypothetical protein [Clostridia bacterium]